MSINTTLLKKIQGGLIGTLIGEQLTYNTNIFLDNSTSKTHFSSWSQLQWQLIEELIENQDCYFSAKIKDKLAELDTLENSAKIALATLGINVYSHENLSFWQKQLNKLIAQSNYQKKENLDLMVWGEVIALILKNKTMSQSHFWQQLLVNIQDIDSPLKEKIKIIYHHQQLNKTSREIIKIIKTHPQPENTPLAMAIYYFSDTIENMEISVNRAKNSSEQTLITTALTAGLSGFYNGWDGIPLKWRIIIKKQPIYCSFDKLIYKLFALWCGMTNPQDKSKEIPIAINIY
jgi:hypothetical protein